MAWAQVRLWSLTLQLMMHWFLLGAGRRLTIKYIWWIPSQRLILLPQRCNQMSKWQTRSRVLPWDLLRKREMCYFFRVVASTFSRTFPPRWVTNVPLSHITISCFDIILSSLVKFQVAISFVFRQDDVQRWSEESKRGENPSPIKWSYGHCSDVLKPVGWEKTDRGLKYENGKWSFDIIQGGMSISSSGKQRKPTWYF